MTFTIKWRDSGREPQHPPWPEYPHGVVIDFAVGYAVTCRVELPYPAKRCGVYLAKCNKCGIRMGVTTAGRVDDPRAVILPCFVHQPAKPPRKSAAPKGGENAITIR
jgi:hypothetical protein